MLKRSVKEGGRFQGAPLAAQAWMLADTLRTGESKQRWLVICASDDLAEKWVTAFRAFEERVPAFHLPSWEQSPYSAVSPSLRVRYARVACLGSVTRTQGPLVLCSTLAALKQATLPPSYLRELTFELIKDSSSNELATLPAKLLHLGYLRQDTVEDPGTFSVRGDLLDLFVPGDPWPLRVEFFGDLIERIRPFDPSSQRVLGLLGERSRATVPPARECLVNRDTVREIRARLKSFADESAVPRTTRDPILESVTDGIYTDHADFWAPWAYSTASSALNHFEGPEWATLWSDPVSAQQSWVEHLEAEKERAERAPERGILVPPPESLYLSSQPQAGCRFESVALMDGEPVTSLGIQTSGEWLPKTAPNQLLPAAAQAIQAAQASGVTFTLYTPSAPERLREVLKENQIPAEVRQGTLSEGFVWKDAKIAVLTAADLLGRSAAAKRNPSRRGTQGAAKTWSGLQSLSDLSPGDVIVHAEHGLARYQGLARLSLTGAPMDFLVLEYAQNDKLYLPVYRLNAIQRYAGSSAEVLIDRLGSQRFQKTKEQVKGEIKKLAIDLLTLYAQRAILPGSAYLPADSTYHAFEERFPFDETPGQLQAIEQVDADLESGKLMDRLVCGDVGYGKTEVAIRAAYRTALEGKQAVVLVPTTLLALQHENSFRARLEGEPVRIEGLSRFKSPKQQKETLARLARGEVDILIGTHRLLSKDVQFKSLGLVIVDEEHRFGVEHKERLRALTLDAHTLTLTATPIPRTLHMALSGLRDISVITTPPVDRQPIRTYVSRFDPETLRSAIENEIHRGGQVFYLHNRVPTLPKTAAMLKRLVPGLKIGIAHGQMPEAELEKVMLDFYQQKLQLLLCTTIIESGLDLPSANTILIERADTLGLAQLYQIRGRVGRSTQRGYAYLFIPEEGVLTSDAIRRLEVLQRFVELGSGFQIASHDLEIRGGGDLLGPEQSGNIKAVGFELYMELLEDAIRELREGEGAAPPQASAADPEIKAPFPAFLSEEYVPDVHQRLSLYRRLSASASEEEIQALAEELRERFGPEPPEASNLIAIIRIKALLRDFGISSLTVGPERVSLTLSPGESRRRVDAAKVIGLATSRPHEFQITPDSRWIVRLKTPSVQQLSLDLEKLLRSISL